MMMDTTTSLVPEETLLNKNKRRVLVISWIILIILGYLAMYMLIQREENRDARGWEMRLGLIAGSQARDIEHWLKIRQKTLQNLAENISLKLYMTELSLSATSPESIEPAQQTYLRNLIISSAREGGFQPTIPAPEIHANVRPEPSAGLALFNASGKLLAATAGMPAFSDLPTTITTPKNPKSPIFSSPYLSENNKPSLALRLPIYGVQDDTTTAQPLGFLVGVTLLDDSLFDLLKTIDSSNISEESLLIATQEAHATYLSPLRNGTKPLTLSLTIDTPNAEIQALLRPQTFIRATSYHKTDAIAVASPIKNTPWHLIRMIDYKNAMQDTHARALWLSIAYALAVALLSASIVAVWRNATTLQARNIADHFRAMAHRLERQEKLLDLIAENTPISTFITDNDGHYRYANRMAAQRAGTKREDMLGKALDAVLGKFRARNIVANNERAIEQQETYITNTITYDDIGNIEEAIESVHIPLANIPIVDSEENIPGILVLEKDFTQAASASEKRAKTLKQLVTTLVTIVDRRDPNAANHSTCVAHLAEAIAKEMGLDEQDITTAATAGNLMNIGKILVPETILTANDDKDEAHRLHIRHALRASADLLENIDFDGPVVETLRQSGEHMDGYGTPLGLKGDDILITARIVGLANDFIAIISPRAWRKGNSQEQATKIALEGIDKKYDRAAVVALINFLDNRNGKELLSSWMQQ